MIQVDDDDHLVCNYSSVGGTEGLSYGNISIIKPIGFANRLGMRYERKREVSDAYKNLAWATGRMKSPLSEIGRKWWNRCFCLVVSYFAVEEQGVVCLG